MKQSPRSFVSQLDFRTSCGYLRAAARGAPAASRARVRSAVITDFGVLRPDPDSGELQLTALYPGSTVAAARAATGWPLKVARRP